MSGVFGKKLPVVGGFNPFKKYESKWKSSPNRGENTTTRKNAAPQ